MGYERFIKKIFPFIGNQYTNSEDSGNIPAGGYVIDGVTYDYKVQGRILLQVHAIGEDEKVYLKTIGLTKNDNSIPDKEILTHDDSAENYYVGINLITLDGQIVDTKGAYYDGEYLNVNNIEIDIENCEGVPPYTTADKDTKLRAILKDKYITVDDFNECSISKFRIDKLEYSMQEEVSEEIVYQTTLDITYYYSLGE